jgi:hypothetical protein
MFRHALSLSRQYFIMPKNLLPKARTLFNEVTTGTQTKIQNFNSTF